ncbi:MAG: DNA-processing protein DprA [Chloroflexi bacterium]|nr:DNA-processing protein DprA [Chloroflexota bacterium]
MSDLKYWLGFSLVQGIGYSKFQKIVKYFKNMEHAWYSSPAELKMAGLDQKIIEAIITARSEISLDTELEKLQNNSVQAITWQDNRYPPRLKEIYDSPPVLFVRGTLLPCDELSISVVGTRKATVYGKEVTRKMVTDLVSNKLTIVSGLARGIDTIAHRTALEAGGRTIAIFACGLDTVYPPENLKLAQAIIENGAIVSDYPLGTKPRPEYFPRRNRIMSGLSLGVLIVEAAESSGALITADLALEQNREVYAVPGNITSPLSRGTNNLIQEGAKLVQSAGDILEDLNLAIIPKQLNLKQEAVLDDLEISIIKYLSGEPVHIDEVCHKSSLPINKVSSTLAMMELKGLVRQVGPMNYILSQ